ncbi:sialidase family protein [Aquimonas voraii]|uniref:sialidase family protein n=1 Tax=Aquimonas voraii TaxID=265719 RepID=UPI000AB4AC07|nr:sialidase family protein [Aquimonas voraii]
MAAQLLSLFGAGIALAEPARLIPIELPIEASALTPHVVADAAKQRFLLSWQERLPEGCARLQVATLSMAGELGEAREVARGCDWFVNWADHPQIAVADNGGWWAFWLQKEGPGTYHYGIRVVHSQDEGATWSAPIAPHDDGTLSEHGFVSMAPDGADRMRLIWLDGRHAAAERTSRGDSADGHGAHEGAMSLRAAVLDASGAIREGEELDARTCSCCWTALLRRPDGSHLAAWRDRSDHEIRDIALATRDRGGWQVSGLVHADNWKIQACPVNGPALAQHDERVFAAWSTMPNANDMAVRLRVLGAESTPLRVEQGPAVLGRVDAEAFDGGLLLSWLGAGAPGESVLRLGLFDAQLGERQRIDVVALPAGRGIGVPRLAALQHRAALVWTEPKASTGPSAPPATQLRGVMLSPPPR